MFERYNEPARRAIFFARYEASRLGQLYIETEHLLLGLIRESDKLLDRLTIAERQAIHNRIDSLSTAPQHVPQSVDLPLSHDCKRALAYAAEEVETLGHAYIEPGHLVLGVLRVEKCLAAALLHEYGVTYKSFRHAVNESEARETTSQFRKVRPAERSALYESPARECTSESLRVLVQRLEYIVEQAVRHLDTTSPTYGQQLLKRRPWSRAQALGHLIDLASAHHQWFARALSEPKLTIPIYPEDEWVTAQRYKDFSWPDLVDCWISLNRLLVHVLTVMPEHKVNIPVRIGIEEPTTLLKVVERYVGACEDILEQVLSRL
jgi:hypothetical protein